MNAISSRDNLIEALRNTPRSMREKLDSLKPIGQDLSNRADLVWHMLLQSMSGMGNNRGYARLILNEANYRKVAWETVKVLPKSKRLAHMKSGLAAATVRMPEQKARWLIDNFEKIEHMGGIEGALERMRSLKGRAEKTAFFRQFTGIGDKYGRNIWMDLCDPDFRDAIAIDVRLKKMYALLDIATGDYARAEQMMLDIAQNAGVTGWELDRLLFHFSDHFLAAVGVNVLPDHREVNRPDKKEHISTKAGAIAPNSKQNIAPLSHDAGSAGLKWEKMYEWFLTRRNTSSWGKKADYARKLLREFNDRVPLMIVVDDTQREALCEKLFRSSNDFNFVIYALGMGVYLGALRRDGDHLVVDRPALL
jgi:hypothetical protein